MESKKKRSWFEVIDNTTAQDISQDISELIICESTTTLGDVCNFLENKAISVPVMDTITSVFIGFLDILDIFGYLITSWDHFSQENEKYLRLPAFLNKISSIQISNAIEFSNWEFPCSIPNFTPITFLIDMFCGSGKYHILLTRDLIPFRIISQLDIIRFLNDNIDTFESHNQNLKNSKISDLSLIQNCHGFKMGCSIHCAIEALSKNHLYSSVVINSENEIMGYITIQHLKNIKTLQFLHCPILKFLRMNQIEERPPTCEFNATFRELISKMVTSHCNRIFIVGETGKLKGVISSNDIILLLKKSEFNQS